MGIIGREWESLTCNVTDEGAKLNVVYNNDLSTFVLFLSIINAFLFLRRLLVPTSPSRIFHHRRRVLPINSSVDVSDSCISAV
jgi:hypothetical protein